MKAIVEQNATVELHFSLALENGDIIDSNFESKPVSFRVGDGNMLPGFENCLIGLHAGEEIEKLVPAEDAFGVVHTENQHRFPIAKFKHLLEDDLIPTEVGSVVSFKDAGGFDLPGVITAMDEGSVHVDFNHPLAGKDVLFRARITSVLEPDQQAVEIKL